MQPNNNNTKTIIIRDSIYTKNKPKSSLTIDTDNLSDYDEKTSNIDSNNNTNTKTIFLAKEKKNRTETFTWNVTENQLTKQQQLHSLNDLYNVLSYTHLRKLTNYEKILKNHISAKILNYKYQDIHKDRFNHLRFTNLLNTINLLITSNLTCHYCNQDVFVLYEKVRENSQWTLDRINNDLGHNINNLVISCLDCNISRKRIKKDSFLFTKQLSQNKITKLGICENYETRFKSVVVVDDSDSDSDIIF